MKKRYAVLALTALMAINGTSAAMAEGELLDNNEQIEAENGAGENGAAADDLIVDDGKDVLSSEGRSFEDVKKEEEEQAKAKAELEAILNTRKLVLDTADKGRIEGYLEELLSMPNPTGSEEEMFVASYIEEQMAQWGYTISEQNFHEGELGADGIDVPGINIIAERGASSKSRTDGIVVVTCHYDASDNGFNDKAGAAVLLETGRILAQIDTDVDLCFVFLSGEEDGWYGSKMFAQSIGDAEKARIRAVINLEDVEEGTRLYLGTMDGMINKAGSYLAAAAGIKAQEMLEGTDFWTCRVRENGPTFNFASEGMQSISIFRENPDDEMLLDELFDEDMSELAEKWTEAETDAEDSVSDDPDMENTPETVTEAALEAEPETETGAEEKTSEKLAALTDILTTALAAYMQPTSVVLD